MDRMVVELSALAFEAAVTAAMALVYTRLWRRQRQPAFASWAIAWTLYAVRLGCISAFLVVRNDVWLFAHQIASGLASMFLLVAAFQFSRGTPWRVRYLWFALLPIAWSYVSVFVIRNMMVAGTTSVVLLSAVTLWTAWVFWRHRRQGGGWSRALAITFALWGLHHLDYPLLRPLGEGVLYGVFADVAFIVAVSMLTMFLVLREGRAALEVRNQQLEQLTRLLLRAQEDERRRIARELHDEAGQVLTAVKMELDTDGRTEASALVARAIDQLRDLSNLIRPSALEDLGLVPALRAMTEDFARRTRIRVDLEADDPIPALGREAEVALYRAAQEALTNVARHARAKRVQVSLAAASGTVRLRVEDDGVGAPGEPTPNLGLLGMRERVAASGGTLTLGGVDGGGFRIEIALPGGGA